MPLPTGTRLGPYEVLGAQPIGALKPQVPIPLRWIVDRCFAKEPAGRCAATGDLAKELATVRDRLAEATWGDRAGLATGGRSRPRLALAALALLSGAVFWLGPHDRKLIRIWSKSYSLRMFFGNPDKTSLHKSVILHLA